MRLARRVIFLAFVAAVAGASVEALSGQEELDRIVARVNNRIITKSDLRQARELQLVEHPDSDQSALRDLENRVLILGDLARSAPLGPASASAVADRRRSWESRIGGQARAARLLADNGMTEAGLESWLADDLRAEAHLRRQFGSLPEANRHRAIEDWIARLRQRAGLR